MKRYLSIISLVAVLAFASLANANNFVSNGSGLIYDQNQNITWYDFVETSGMNWYEATNWVQSLTIGGVSGWRLPTISPTNEMNNLYYELGNYYGQATVNIAPFSNLIEESYWTSTEVDATLTYIYNFNLAQVHAADKLYSSRNVIAVHDGNISASVPEPTTLLLLGLGFLGLAGARRKFTN